MVEQAEYLWQKSLDAGHIILNVTRQNQKLYNQEFHSNSNVTIRTSKLSLSSVRDTDHPFSASKKERPHVHAEQKSVFMLTLLLCKVFSPHETDLDFCTSTELTAEANLLAPRRFN